MFTAIPAIESSSNISYQRQEKLIILRYRSILWSFLNRRTKNTWDTEDLIQEVFLKITKSGDTLHNNFPVAYILQIAKCVLYDKFRRDKVRQADNHCPLPEMATHLNTTSPPFPTYSEKTTNTASPETIVGDRESYNCYLAVLSALTPKTRNIFLLSRYEGFTYSEIAGHYKISVSSVEKHMMKALAKFRSLNVKKTKNAY